MSTVQLSLSANMFSVHVLLQSSSSFIQMILTQTYIFNVRDRVLLLLLFVHYKSKINVHVPVMYCICRCMLHINVSPIQYVCLCNCALFDGLWNSHMSVRTQSPKRTCTGGKSQCYFCCLLVIFAVPLCAVMI